MVSCNSRIAKVIRGKVVGGIVAGEKELIKVVLFRMYMYIGSCTVYPYDCTDNQNDNKLEVVLYFLL